MVFDMKQAACGRCGALLWVVATYDGILEHSSLTCEPECPSAGLEPEPRRLPEEGADDRIPSGVGSNDSSDRSVSSDAVGLGYIEKPEGITTVGDRDSG